MEPINKNIKSLKKASPQYDVFHGTDKSFDLRDMSEVNKSTNSTAIGWYDVTRHGIFLTNNENFAKQYGKNILSLTVDIKNPALINEDIQYDFVSTLDPFQERELWLQAKHAQKTWNLFDGDVGERFVNFLKQKGYDGAIFEDMITQENGEEVEGTTYVAFSRNQIKQRQNKENVISLDKHTTSQLYAIFEKSIKVC